jgi:hypothetical protein
MDRDTHANGAVSDYREFPAPSLARRSSALLVGTKIMGTRDVFVHRVLQDACLDIVFINDEALVVVGPWTEPFLARLTPGTMILGARCHPGLAPSLLGLPASELLNQSVPLRAIRGFLVGNFSFKSRSSPSNAQFESAGEIIPPNSTLWGPIRRFVEDVFFHIPGFSHFRRMTRSIGT